MVLLQGSTWLTLSPWSGANPVTVAHSSLAPLPGVVLSELFSSMGTEARLCRRLTSALSPASEEEQSTLPYCRHHQLPGPLHLPGGPPGGLCPALPRPDAALQPTQHPQEPHRSSVLLPAHLHGRDQPD